MLLIGLITGGIGRPFKKLGSRKQMIMVATSERDCDAKTKENELRGSRSHVHRYIEVSPPWRGDAWTRMRRGAPWAPEIEGTDCVSENDRCLPGRARRSRSERGETDCVLILIPQRHHHPTVCTQASRIPLDRASGDVVLSSHHQCTGILRTKISRTMDDLQRTHRSSKVRATFAQR